MGVPVVKSPNPEVTQPLTGPSQEFDYSHPLQGRKATPIPIAFQITSPFDRRTALLPHMLVMHVNPANFNETLTKKIERIQTRGGFVEQHWGDELGEISADGSTGAFVNVYTGLSSVLRQRTIAWDRFRDLYDLFHHNGSVYDPSGNIVLQGNVMLMYDRGTYIGYFRAFDVEETAESPFAFQVNWTFKVQETILKLPGLSRLAATASAPAFQAQNLLGNTLSAATMGASVEEDGRVSYDFTSESAQAALDAETAALQQSEADALEQRSALETQLAFETQQEEQAQAALAAERAAAEEAARQQQDLARRKKAGR